MADSSDGSGRIKLFKFIQKSYEHNGIFPSESNENRGPINSRNTLDLFCHAQFFISSAAYLLVDANSMIEYGMTFYVCITLVTSSVIYLTEIWQMKNISNFIGHCERFIEMSECTESRSLCKIYRNRTHFSCNHLTLLY